MATSKKTTEKKKTGGKTVAKTTQTKAVRKRRTAIKTHDGYPLTANEASFIDEYIQSGNGLQSYLKAYPRSNPSNARQNSYRLLNKDYIASEISFRLEQAKNESIASAEEIMNYLSDVMRGKIKDAFGLEASLSERTRAAVELAKRQIDIPNKMSNNEAPEIKITLDWGQGQLSPTVQEVLGDTTPPTIDEEEDK